MLLSRKAPGLPMVPERGPVYPEPARCGLGPTADQTLCKAGGPHDPRGRIAPPAAAELRLPQITAELLPLATPTTRWAEPVSRRDGVGRGSLALCPQGAMP